LKKPNPEMDSPDNIYIYDGMDSVLVKENFERFYPGHCYKVELGGNYKEKKNSNYNSC